MLFIITSPSSSVILFNTPSSNIVKAVGFSELKPKIPTVCPLYLMGCNKNELDVSSSRSFFSKKLPLKVPLYVSEYITRLSATFSNSDVFLGNESFNPSKRFPLC